MELIPTWWGSRRSNWNIIAVISSTTKFFSNSSDRQYNKLIFSESCPRGNPRSWSSKGYPKNLPERRGLRDKAGLESGSPFWVGLFDSSHGFYHFGYRDEERLRTDPRLPVSPGGHSTRNSAFPISLQSLLSIALVIPWPWSLRLDGISSISFGRSTREEPPTHHRTCSRTMDGGGIIIPG